MMMTVNHITIANTSEWIHSLSAKAVASDTTTDECTDGIPPLQRARSTSHLPLHKRTIIPLIHTERTKATAGTKITDW
jgi:hypothetical protein